MMTTMGGGRSVWLNQEVDGWGVYVLKDKLKGVNVKKKFTIKTILRMLELAFKLKVNFFKSCFWALDVGGEVVERYASMSNCKILLSLPFEYLGIGINPRRVEMLKPNINKFFRKLALWKHKNVLFGIGFA